MLLYRSVAVGLLGAACLLLATRPLIRTRIVHDGGREEIVYRAAPAQAEIVDVAAGVAPAQLAPLVRLGPGEHVTAVDDRAVANDLDAGAALAQLAPRAPTFVDLTLAGGPAGSRRVVLLLH